MSILTLNNHSVSSIANQLDLVLFKHVKVRNAAMHLENIIFRSQKITVLWNMILTRTVWGDLL